MTAAQILDQTKHNMRRGGTLILMGLSVGAMACLTYGQITSYNFTATDTLTLIDTSRVRTIQDALDVLMKPLMAGSNFVESGLFYRPVSSYSYALDFIVWKLNPFGYHLTDLVLHAVASVLVFLTTLVVTRGRRVASWIGALLFTLHPIVVETVPAIARRQDVIAAVFMMLSLLLFAYRQFSSRKGRRGLQGLSVAAYVLALGAKETAILLPVMVAAYAMLFVPTGNDRPAQSEPLRMGFLRACGPYVVVSVVYLGFRLHALGGFGGYFRPGASPVNSLLFWVSTTKQYVMDLVIPVVPPGVLSEEVARAGSLALLVASICLMLLVARSTPFFMPHKVVGGILASPSARVMAYMGFCASLPLALYLAAMSFYHRLMYIPTAFFCSFIGLLFVESTQYVFSLRAPQSKAKMRLGPGLASGCAVLGCSILIVYLVRFSPLVADYGEWRESGNVTGIILSKVSDALPTFPAGATLRFHELPSGIATYQSKLPKAKSVGYLTGYSIKSWLNMMAPEKQLEVVVESYAMLATYSEGLTLEIQSKPFNAFDLYLKGPRR